MKLKELLNVLAIYDMNILIIFDNYHGKHAQFLSYERAKNVNKELLNYKVTNIMNDTRDDDVQLAIIIREDNDD